MTKPIAPDQLKPGMWIIVTDQKFPSIQIQNDGDTVQLPNLIPIQTFEPTGVPIRIAAISLPMIAGFPAISPLQLTTICLRNKVIRQPNSKYVKVFTDHYELIARLDPEILKQAHLMQ